MDTKRHTTTTRVSQTILVVVGSIWLASSGFQLARALEMGQDQSGSSAGSQAASSASSSAASAAANQAQKQFQSMFQFGMSPVTSSMKYLMPNTYDGAASDLSNGYYTLSNGLSNGFSGFTSSLMDRYQALENNVLNRMTRQMQMQEELMNRMYQLVSNPEQVCKQLVDRTKSGIEQTNQQAQQVAESAGSFMRKLGGFPFGK